jgi:putative endopeptidase
MIQPRLLPLFVALAAGTALLAAPAISKAQRKGGTKAAQQLVCTDFYSHANADWLAAHPPIAGSGMQSALGELADRSRQQQLEMLDDDMQFAQGGIAKLLGDFWASGLDEAAVERDGAQPIAPLLSRIDAIRRSRDVPASVAALHQVGIPVLFNFGADVDLADLDRHIGYFTQGGLGLPDPAFYTRTDPDTAGLMAKYRDYVSAILALTGSTPKRLQADTQAVLDIETRIAGASRPMSLLRDPRARYGLVPVAGLDAQYRHLQLGRFLQAQGVQGDSVSLANPQLFAQLDAMVDGIKPDQWKAYLRYHEGAAMAPYLSRAWRDADFAFRGAVLRGASVPPARRDQVLDAINLAAGPMVGREYVTRYLPDATRARATEIAAQVRDALDRGIDRNPWMSTQARTEAKAKLARLKIEVGAPARELDFSVQPMGRGSFGGNMLIASTWRHREEMRRIGSGNAERRWNVQPQQPMLSYDVAQNRLVVSAAMLQPPVLDMNRDPAANYGAFGGLVGHELTHGFDGNGRHVDASNTLRDWWTPADASAWDMQVAPLAVQYGAYPWPGLVGTLVDGARTREENAADLAGVELAMDALLAAQPGLDDAGRQWFYQGWARLWPQQVSADLAERMAASDPHAPGQWRANGPIANQPEFGQAFSCKPGTPMQRVSTQQVKVWR